MFAAKDTLLTRPNAGGYQISRSLRFNSADNPYLTRSFGTSTSDQIMTFSFWCKLSNLGAVNEIIGTNRAYSTRIEFGSGADLDVYVGSPSTSAGSFVWATTSLYRDPSAWYHVVCAIDTTQATATNRVKLWVNGVQITAFGTQQTITQNINVGFSSNTGVRIGYAPSDGSLGAYLTEFYYVDGQGLTPSSFGATNTTTGVWGPKTYAGTYGNNGFYLNFSDNSNTTAATLGKDYSGNGNNFTPNNFSVTAGAGNDSFVDTPTLYGTDTGVGGEVRGNYATLNPLQFAGTNGNNPVDGNLVVNDNPSSNPTKAFSSTIAVTTGKFYAEFFISATTYIQIAAADVSTWTTTYGSGLLYGSGTISWDVSQLKYYINSTGSTATGVSGASSDVLQIAFDADTRKVWFGRNNTWNASGNPSGGTNEIGTVAGTGALVFVVRSENMNVTCNFGQRPFAYTAPSGFKALCTQNLPTPTIGATSATLANKYFDATLYTGDGATNPSSQAIVNAGGFQPDFVWIKSRSNAYPNFVWDVIRGVANDAYLVTNSTAAENLDVTGNQLSSFNSNGFSVQNTTGGLSVGTNNSGSTFVGWQWKGGGTGVSNTSGSITSTVSASTTSGFSVVTWTNPASGVFTFGHGLGVAPSMVLFKDRPNVLGWTVYHIGIGNTGAVFLNTDGGVSTSSGYFNNTSPTSTVVTANQAGVGNANANMVAYCFAPIAGYSAFGSYTANGSTDGPFVFTGFRPAWILFKGAGAGTNWFLFDSKRSTYNIVGNLLYPNGANAENTAGTYLDFLSNGFKIRTTSGDLNSSGTYTYAAFAENPFKYSLAR